MTTQPKVDVKAAQQLKSVQLMGGGGEGGIGAAFGSVLSLVTSSANAAGNLARAAEVMSGVVLTKAENYAALSELQDQANYAVAKAAVDVRIASLREVGVQIDIE